MKCNSVLLFFLVLSVLNNVSGFEFTQATCSPTVASGDIYYVATDGNDYKGDGSRLNPWKSIEFATYKAKDNSTIIVKPGTYTGEVRLKKAFDKGLLIKAEYPYTATLENNARVLAIVNQAQNITIEGFEFKHIDENAKPLVVHIDAYGRNELKNITLKNNIFHDSYNNDLLKVNNGASHINIHCNVFYNQGDSDEHIDLNSVEFIDVADNIFFNDFTASNRDITNKSSSYIVVKDSNDKEDPYLGASNITIQRNIFFNWQGSHGHGFVLIGEDGKPYYEAYNVEIFNNLFIGNSDISMRSPFGVKGARDIKFYNNTVTGDLPSNAYAIRVNRERDNLINNRIYLFNNIWSDPTGSMGQGVDEPFNDFSDVLINQLEEFSLSNNIIFNGGESLPYSLLDKINPDADKYLLNQDPKLPATNNVKAPVWLKEKQMFSDGSYTIRNAFHRLVMFYGIPLLTFEAESKVIESFSIKLDKDIVYNDRASSITIGAYQVD